MLYIIHSIVFLLCACLSGQDQHAVPLSVLRFLSLPKKTGAMDRPVNYRKYKYIFCFCFYQITVSSTIVAPQNYLFGLQVTIFRANLSIICHINSVLVRNFERVKVIIFQISNRIATNLIFPQSLKL